MLPNLTIHALIKVPGFLKRLITKGLKPMNRCLE